MKNSARRYGGTKKIKNGFVSALLLLVVNAAFGAVSSNNEQHADKIIVFKNDHIMQLLKNGHVFKTYKIALGGNPVGPKEQQGDHKTPEGNYIIVSRNPQSLLHKALHVSYPNAEDRAHANSHGVNPGGAIMIHGIEKQYGWMGVAHRLHDWTDGCIAVTNEEIDEIWKLVPDKTPVEIRP